MTKDERIALSHVIMPRRKGKWIIWECTGCDFAVAKHLETGDTRTKSLGDETVLHNGIILNIKSLN